MNYPNKLFTVLRYSFLTAVVILGLVTIIGTGGSSSKNGNGNDGDPVEDGNGSSDGQVANSIGMTFNYINPGNFMMGSPEDELGRLPDETQYHVTLMNGYFMQTTPVTQGQWKAVMGSNPSYFSNCGDDCPVENVSWEDVQHFINKLNALGEYTYRLPTEAEWEYAARAGSTTAFANGPIKNIGLGIDPVLARIGWYYDNSGGKPHPVAQKDPNAWGLYDMHGNVREWVMDWYGDYPEIAATDPTGPSSGTLRVLRGGHCTSTIQSCRSASRSSWKPNQQGPYFGFRVILDSKPIEANIIAPSDNSKFIYGDTITFIAEGTDLEYGTLPASAFAWESSIDGIIETGSKEFSTDFLSLGIHTITLTVTNDDSLTDIAKISVSVFFEMPVTNPLGMTFNYIEPGSFMMGSPTNESGRDSDEIRHKVTLTKGYFLQTTPVTQGQWKAVMGSNPSYFSNCGDNCPVDSVSWNDAQIYIDKLNSIGEYTYRLPTEAEWEYAARAGSNTAFAKGEITHTGDGYDPVLDSMGWYRYNAKSRTHRVALRNPNAWGLYDMHGGVWEWVADWYGDYPATAVTDPDGPKAPQYGTRRVMRGGSWLSDAKECRSAKRNVNYPSVGLTTYGFRIVLLPNH